MWKWFFHTAGELAISGRDRIRPLNGQLRPLETIVPFKCFLLVLGLVALVIIALYLCETLLKTWLVLVRMVVLYVAVGILRCLRCRDCNCSDLGIHLSTVYSEKSFSPNFQSYASYGGQYRKFLSHN